MLRRFDEVTAVEVDQAEDALFLLVELLVPRLDARSKASSQRAISARSRPP